MKADVLFGYFSFKTYWNDKYKIKAATKLLSKIDTVFAYAIIVLVSIFW